jgi:hypothetical protein
MNTPLNLLQITSRNKFVLFDHHLNILGFEEKPEHRIVKNTQFAVGDYLYYTQAVSGPEDMTTFYRIMKITPKQVVIELDEFVWSPEANHNIPVTKEVRLKKHEYRPVYNNQDTLQYSLKSGRYSFFEVISQEEFKNLLAKLVV